MTLKLMVGHRWFALADLALVSFSCVLWEIEPGVGWVPLLVALFPWFLRLVAGRFPFQRTPFDIPMVVFILTAAMGTWTAYNHELAWAKFWLILSGVLLFYALAGQPRKNQWIIASYLCLVGIGLAVFFLLTYNWQLYPAKVGILDRIGLWWMTVRPPVGVAGIDHDDAAGMLGFISPFLIAIGIRAWKEKRIFSLLYFVIGAGLFSIAFLMATSRGASMGVAVGLGAWLLWVLSQRAGSFIHYPPKTIFVTAIILLAALISGLLLTFRGNLAGLTDTIPGAVGRLELDNGAINLISDFPFTGAGLNTFPGLFSQYVLITPFFYILNSHNIYLDIALEQSGIGLLAFAVIYLGSAWRALKAVWKNPGAWLNWASLAGLAVAMVHGLVQNVIYGMADAPFLFLLPGMAYAMTRTGSPETSHLRSTQQVITGRRLHPAIFSAALVAVITLIGLAYRFRQPLLAAWDADLGSVQMAQAELAHFPTNQWDEGKHLERYTSAEKWFTQALRYNPGNRTANYRMGLIAMERRDYPSAVSYLSAAYQADPGYRGIVKSLGYSLAWVGQYQKAVAILKNIPEARQEMSVYSGWWTTQGRPDLAQNAATMVRLLDSAGG